MTKKHSNIEIRTFAQNILRALSAGFMGCFLISSIIYFVKAFEIRANNEAMFLTNETYVASKDLTFNIVVPSVYANFDETSAKQNALNRIARRLLSALEENKHTTNESLERFKRKLQELNDNVVLYNGLIARAGSEFDSFNILYIGTNASEVRQSVLSYIFDHKISREKLDEYINYLLASKDGLETNIEALKGLLKKQPMRANSEQIEQRESTQEQIEGLEKISRFYQKSASLLRTMGEINENKAKILRRDLDQAISAVKTQLAEANLRLLSEQTRILVAAGVLFALGAIFTGVNFYYGVMMSRLLDLFYRTFMASPVQQSLIRIQPNGEYTSEITNNAFRFGSGALKNISTNFKMKEANNFYLELSKILALDDDARGFEVGTLVYESYNKLSAYDENAKASRKDGKFFTIFRRQIMPGYELINKVDVSKTVWQVKDYKEHLDTLRRKLEHDDLTDLLSLQALQDNEINNPKGSTNKIFLYLHIDHFNDVRLNYSTVVIDEIIKAFANSLKQALDVKDNHKSLKTIAIYHLQLDEFAIVYNSLAQAQEAAECIIRHFKNNSVRDGRNKFNLRFGNGERLIDLELNIGISSERDITRHRSNGRGDESINRLAQAIIASYESARTKAPYVVYEEGKLGVELQYAKQQQLAVQIRQALKTDSIFLVAQGVHDSKSLAVQYYELLVRMRASDGSVITPDAFLGIARRVGLYKDIQRVVISKAFGLLARHPQAHFSINLANSDIVNAETRQFFLTQLERCPNAQNLCVEILESEGIEQYDEVVEFLSAVKARGAKVAIDDFGSGYSNYYRLLKVQFDYLKIDGSIISSLPHDENAHVVLKTIVEFAHEQGYEVVAEFVSSAEILQIIREFGIDKSQGYELSKPEPPELIFG